MKISQYKKLNNTIALKLAHKKCERLCHLWIRLKNIRWTEGLGYSVVCLACNKRIEINLFSDKSIMNGRQIHASHYFDSEQYESVRYEEDNIHTCCYRCNRMKHGNKENYGINLKQKIGEDRFEKLKIKAHKTYKFNIVELEQLADEFKLKAKHRAIELKIKI